MLVLYADMPLVRVDTLRALCAQAQDDRVVMLTAYPDAPDGFGRIIRDKTGAVTGIVEEADATAKQRAIREVNTGILVAPAKRLGQWLPEIGNDNQQGERYLTDVVAMAVADGVDVVAHAVRENIRSTVDELQHKSQVLSQLAVKDGLLVVGAEYCLDTGVVAFFDIDG